MRSGRKLHLVELRKPAPTKGPTGEKTITYLAEHEAYAGIEDIKSGSPGRDYEEGQDTYRDTKLIVFDYYPDFKSTWRIYDVEMGVEYEVLKLDNPQRRNIEFQAVCKSLEDV